MKKNAKIIILTALSFLWTLIVPNTFAQINVRSDLGNAVQNIQKVYFSPDGIQDPDPDKNILVEIKDGVISVHGRVIITQDQDNNLISGGNKNSLLFLGTGHQLEGNNNILIGGESNRISKNTENSLIAGGENNKIIVGNNNYVMGSTRTTLSWTQNIVFAGKFTDLLWEQILSLWAKNSKILGSTNVVGGNGIKFNKPFENLFVWSDNKQRNIFGGQYFIPQSSKTFLVRSDNGIGIATNSPQVKGIDVNGMLQIWSSENPQIPDANLTFKNGCFCTRSHDGKGISISQSSSCITKCKM